MMTSAYAVVISDRCVCLIRIPVDSSLINLSNIIIFKYENGEKILNLNIKVADSRINLIICSSLFSLTNQLSWIYHYANV